MVLSQEQLDLILGGIGDRTANYVRVATASAGVKHDDGKTDWSLLPYDALEPIVRVLMHGAEKYGAENWRDVPDGERRYWNAAMRHLIAYMSGTGEDDESGMSNLAHAACNVIFLIELARGE